MRCQHIPITGIGGTSLAPMTSETRSRPSNCDTIGWKSHRHGHCSALSVQITLGGRGPIQQAEGAPWAERGRRVLGRYGTYPCS